MIIFLSFKGISKIGFACSFVVSSGSQLSALLPSVPGCHLQGYLKLRELQTYSRAARMRKKPHSPPTFKVLKPSTLLLYILLEFRHINITSYKEN